MLANSRVEIDVRHWINPSVGPVFMEGEVKSERHLQVLNDVLETYVNETSLTGRRRFGFQQVEIRYHFAGKVRSW